MLPSESSLPIARRATWRDTECLELVCGIANAVEVASFWMPT